MEPRLSRIQRNKKQKKIGIGRKFQHTILISTIIIAAPGLVGTTYGQFTDTEASENQITACAIFPSVVEQSMKELITELEMLQQHVNQLKQIGVPAGLTDYTSGLAEENNSKQILAEASGVAEYISSLGKGISEAEAMLSSSSGLWQEINKEATVIIELTNKIIWYSKTYNENCLELNSQETLKVLGNHINESVLQESAMQTMIKMIHYYDGIYHAGISFEEMEKKGVLNKEQVLRMFLRERGISNQSFSSLALADIIDEKLVLFFQQQQTSLTDYIQNMSAAKEQSLVLQSSLINQAEEKKAREELEEAEKPEGEKPPVDGEQPKEDPEGKQPKIEEPAGDGESPGEEGPAAEEEPPSTKRHPTEAVQPAPEEPTSELEQPQEETPPAIEEQPQIKEAPPVNEQLPEKPAPEVQAVIPKTEEQPVPTQQPS